MVTKTENATRRTFIGTVKGMVASFWSILKEVLNRHQVMDKARMYALTKGIMVRSRNNCASNMYLKR